MEDLEIKRMDHHGLVMGIIKDLDLIEQIDSRVGRYDDEQTTVGERVAALIINGLGFTDQPVSLVADAFKEMPLEVLFGRKLNSDDFNRFSLSRALDRLSDYGESQLFTEVSAVACSKEAIDLAHQSFDTTSFSVTGNEYEEEGCEIKVTHGYSKDHRPDLKQIVSELLVSHDGGIPLILKNWSGNTSDTEIFKERTQQLIESFQSGYAEIIVADSKFYTENNSQYWDKVNFITRAPETLKAVKAAISSAVVKDDWQYSECGMRYQVIKVTHYNSAQRWVVCSSEQSLARAKKTLEKSVEKEKTTIEKSLYHLQAESFGCEKDAQKQITSLSKKWRYHSLIDTRLEPCLHYSKRGKPAATDKPTNTTYKVKVSYELSETNLEQLIKEKSCFVLASNVLEEKLSPSGIIASYKKQQTVERGYRFLKDPHFFTSALFLKTPSRISALIMVMTLSLLVYSIAQRRLRKALVNQNTTLPDQTKKPTKKITMRWAFRILRGINLVRENNGTWVINAMSDLKAKLIRLVSGSALSLYQLDVQVAEVALDTG